MRDKAKSSRQTDKRASRLKGGEFKRTQDEADDGNASAPSLSDTDWADLPAREREKRQRG